MAHIDDMGMRPERQNPFAYEKRNQDRLAMAAVPNRSLGNRGFMRSVRR